METGPEPRNLSLLLLVPVLIMSVLCVPRSAAGTGSVGISFRGGTGRLVSLYQTWSEVLDRVRTAGPEVLMVTLEHSQKCWVQRVG